jgi:hypothetical protein
MCKLARFEIGDSAQPPGCQKQCELTYDCRSAVLAAWGRESASSVFVMCILVLMHAAWIYDALVRLNTQPKNLFPVLNLILDRIIHNVDR